MWYREHVGGDRCPVVDTWWQTETGMIMITPLPGVTTTKPGSATKPFPGVEAGVFNEAGEEVGPGGGGYLVLKRPWPAMTRGIYGDDARFRRDVLGEVPRRLLRRRRRADRRGRRLLAARPRRRRDERLRPPDLDDRGRVGARRSPARRRGGGLRARRRADGPGDRRLRDAEGRRRGLARDARGAAQPRRREDRPDREAREHRLHARAPEDALRQDHAPPPARRGREPPARRHDDARRPDGRQRDRRPRRRDASDAGESGGMVLVAGRLSHYLGKPSCAGDLAGRLSASRTTTGSGSGRRRWRSRTTPSRITAGTGTSTRPSSAWPKSSKQATSCSTTPAARGSSPSGCSPGLPARRSGS